MRAAILVLAGACSFDASVPVVDGAVVDAPGGESGRTMFIVEAEAFTSEAVSTTHDWTEVTTIGGYSGTGYMILSPDNSTPCPVQAAVTACAASLVFDVPIDEMRTYYVYLRMYASNGSHDSVWFGFDGAVEDVIDVMEDSTWRWTGGKPRVLAPGPHRLHVWQREGARLDVVAIMPTATAP